MITWEFAKDRYKLSEFFLETLAILTSPNICNAVTRMVKDMWGRNEDN